MVRLKCAPVDMIRDVGDKWFVMFWERDSVMGWVVRRVKSVKKAVEFSLAYITDVAKVYEIRLP
jgi:hypothetical protein